MELSWAICCRSAFLWSSRTSKSADRAELAELDPADLFLIVDKKIKVLDDATAAEIVRRAADDVAIEIRDGTV